MSNKQELMHVCSALGFLCTADMTEAQMMDQIQFYQANGGMKLDYYANNDNSDSADEDYYAIGGDDWDNLEQDFLNSEKRFEVLHTFFIRTPKFAD